MRRKTNISVGILVALVLTACGVDPIVGTWTSGPIVDEVVQTDTWVFRSDHTFTKHGKSTHHSRANLMPTSRFLGHGRDLGKRATSLKKSLTESLLRVHGIYPSRAACCT